MVTRKRSGELRGGSVFWSFMFIIGTSWMWLASAADITVTAPSDSGAGSLRDAVENQAVAGNSIDFDPSVTTIDFLTPIAVQTPNLSLAGTGGPILAGSINSIVAMAMADPESPGLDNAIEQGKQDLLDSIQLSPPQPTLNGRGTTSLFAVTDDGLSADSLVFTMGNLGFQSPNFTGGNITNNTGAADVSHDGSAIYYGGAAIAADGKDLATLNGNLFSGNVSSATGGTVGTGTAITSQIVVNGDASASADAGADGSVTIYGGAVRARNIDAITNSAFTNNLVIANGGTTTSTHASASADGSNSSNFSVMSEARTSITANTNAYGGAVSATDISLIQHSVFDGNQVLVNVGDATSGNADAHSKADALGYSYIDITVRGSPNSRITATSSGRGGAIDAVTLTQMDSVLIMNNSVVLSGGRLQSGATTGSYTIDLSSGNFLASVGSPANSSISATETLFGGAVAATLVQNASNLVYNSNSVSITGSNMLTGSATSTNNANSSATGIGSGYGGALYAATIDTMNYSIFMGNSLIVTQGDAQTGTGTTRSVATNNSNATSRTLASVEAAGYGGAVYASTVTDFANNVLVGNMILVSGGTALAADATASATSTKSGYPARATATASAQADVIARGGALYSASAEMSGNLFIGNISQATGGDATAGLASATATAVTYGNATASADASAQAIARAEGGAVYSDTVVSSNDVFVGNSAKATGGTARAGTIAGNPDTVVLYADGSAVADGGAVFLIASTDSVFTDATFIGNTASAEVTMPGANAIARGGAIYVETSGSGATSLTLAATAGKETLFQGNTAVTPSGTASNSLYFGRAYDADGKFNDSGADAALYIAPEEGGFVKLLDPMTVSMNNDKSFSLFKTGLGEFQWGGTNTFDAAGSGGSYIGLTGGTTVALSDLTLRTSDANNMSVVLGAGHTLNIDLNRDPNLSLFDFTSALDKTFVAETGTQIGPDLSRTIIDVHNKYLLVDGLDYQVDDSGIVLNHAPGLNLGLDHSPLGQLWLTVNYQSNFTGCKNVMSSRYALNALLNDSGANISNDQAAAVLANLSSTNPEYAVSMGIISLGLQQKVADLAVYYAFDDRYQDLGAGYGAVGSGSANAMVASPERHGKAPTLVRGPQFWAGYVGDFSRMDKHNCYYGYRTTTNGALMGANYVFSDMFKTGIYGGYTHTQTDYREMTADISTDAGHFGALGRYTNNNFVATLDANYAFFSNSGTRDIGSQYRVDGKFNQHVFGAGLGLNYDFLATDTFTISPFAGVRYSYLHQNGLDEHGQVTAAHLDGINGYSLYTDLGSSFALDIPVSPTAWVTPRLSAAWRHEFGDKQVGSSAYYFNTSPMYYGVKSIEKDRDSAVLGAEIAAKFLTTANRQWSIRVAYTCELSSNRQDHTVFGGVAVDF